MDSWPFNDVLIPLVLKFDLRYDHPPSIIQRFLLRKGAVGSTRISAVKMGLSASLRGCRLAEFSIFPAFQRYLGRLMWIKLLSSIIWEIPAGMSVSFCQGRRFISVCLGVFDPILEIGLRWA